MKIRIKFRKYGVMKFIGHLDIMRFFQKAIRRSGIDICYSEGFSPHQIMSFAAPLGVGLTSDGEYVDIEVHTTLPTDRAIAALNQTMVEGMEITGYVQLPDNAKTAMSMVAAADYEIYYKNPVSLPYSVSELSKQLSCFCQRDEIFITKKTKKSERLLNIRPLIYDFLVLPPFTQDQEQAASTQPMYYLKVSTGSTDNLKPELALEAFYQSIDLPYDPYALQIHRKDVYFREEDGSLQPLLHMGTKIPG